MIHDASNWLIHIEDVDGNVDDDDDGDDDDDDDDDGDNGGWRWLLLNTMMHFFCLISDGWHLCSGSFIIDDERWLDDPVDASWWSTTMGGWSFIKQICFACCPYHIP